MRWSRFLSLLFLVLLLFPTLGPARTWYIVPDGTGDAQTIQAGVDSAGAGDDISLANGTYTGDGNRDVSYSRESYVKLLNHFIKP